MRNDVGQCVGLQRPQRGGDVVELELQVATDGIGGGRLADALCRRPQLAGERVLHRRLQPGETVVAELAG